MSLTGIRISRARPFRLLRAWHRGQRGRTPSRVGPGAIFSGLLRRQRPRPISLALQGGGAHGAFTWGVLDRLLADGRFDIKAISGTSAGALNAVVMADALLREDADAAREALQRFWLRISTTVFLRPYRGGHPASLATWGIDAGEQDFGLDLWTRLLSPYQFNPFDKNPIREVLQDTVDFDRLRRNRTIRLFLAATNVETARARIFETHELDLATVLASCALPTLHHAVQIEGSHYWDGGYTANPPILPLARYGRCRDLLLVQIDGAMDDGVPVSAGRIRSRINRVVFAAPLLRELEMLQLLREVRACLLPGTTAHRLRSLRLHRIAALDALRRLGEASKLSPDWHLLTHLCEIGHTSADAWLKDKGSAVGRSSSFDPLTEPV